MWTWWQVCKNNSLINAEKKPTDMWIAMDIEWSISPKNQQAVNRTIQQPIHSIYSSFTLKVTLAHAHNITDEQEYQ